MNQTILSDDEVFEMLESGNLDISKLQEYCKFHEINATWDKTKRNIYYKAKSTKR